MREIPAPCLSRRSPYRSVDRIRGTPAHFLCEIELLRWPDATLMRRRPGFLGMKLVCPDGLEDRRRRRLDRAFSKKCPKLQQCKAEGARTVLVLESDDIALTSFDLIGNQLPAVLAGRRDAPDDIFLVQTDTDPWWVWLMKQDDDHWPAVVCWNGTNAFATRTNYRRGVCPSGTEPHCNRTNCSAEIRANGPQPPSTNAN